MDAVGPGVDDLAGALRPAWVDVLVRTSLYALGVFVVLVLEHGFKERH